MLYKEEITCLSSNFPPSPTLPHKHTHTHTKHKHTQTLLLRYLKNCLDLMKYQKLQTKKDENYDKCVYKKYII